MAAATGQVAPGQATRLMVRLQGLVCTCCRTLTGIKVVPAGTELPVHQATLKRKRPDLLSVTTLAVLMPPRMK